MEKERLNMWVMLVAEIKDSQARLARWEEWGATVKRCFPDIVDECCIPEMDELLADMPEVE